MDKSNIYFLLAVQLLDLGLCYTTNQTSKAMQISGGVVAFPGEFPHHVKIYLDGYYLCGGTLISHRHVVTAGHCLEAFLSEPKFHVLKVVAGSNLMHKGKVRRIRAAKRHRNYKVHLGRPWNDVGVLTLTIPFPRTPYIRPIPMASRRYNEYEVGVSIGFGKDNRDSFALSTQLKRYSTRIIDLEECNNYMHGLVRYGDICTYTEYGTGTCFGDSGGPLISNGELIGIISWGENCAVGKPDIFADVFAFKGAILEMMQ